MKKRRIAVDLAKVRKTPTGRPLWTTLAWGEEVDVTKITREHVEVRITAFVEQPDGSIKPEKVTGFIRPPKSGGLAPKDVVAIPSKVKVLNVDFVDVQQGDGTLIETPKGKVVLVDGGDNQLFARYLASRFRDSSDARPRDVDAIVVTHGDADHFSGLSRIFASETHGRRFKRLFIRPRRVFHNGLVKRPSKKAGNKRRKNHEMFGKTLKRNGRTYITGLESNLLRVPERELNGPFREWKRALKAWNKRGRIQFRRLAKGDDDAFAFLRDEGIEVEVLGPITTRIGRKQALPFLGSPPKGPRIGHESLSLSRREFGGISASHTVNGHSIVLRVRYGNFHFLLAGDLNDEAERELTRAHNAGDVNLRSEVFKVPHHGSADFSAAFVQGVSPVVSVVSSGDESSQKEFIHPRSTLLGALGRYSRLAEPLVFVTELVAFFKMEGYVQPGPITRGGTTQSRVVKPERGRFFAFSRTAFGLVRVLTDGDRMLVYTNSGRSDLKEAYAYRVDESGAIVATEVRSA